MQNSRKRKSAWTPHYMFVGMMVLTLLFILYVWLSSGDVHFTFKIILIYVLFFVMVSPSYLDQDLYRQLYLDFKQESYLCQVLSGFNVIATYMSIFPLVYMFRQSKEDQFSSSLILIVVLGMAWILAINEDIVFKFYILQKQHHVSFFKIIKFELPVIMAPTASNIYLIHHSTPEQARVTWLAGNSEIAAILLLLCSIGIGSMIYYPLKLKYVRFMSGQETQNPPE